MQILLQVKHTLNLLIQDRLQEFFLVTMPTSDATKSFAMFFRTSERSFLDKTFFAINLEFLVKTFFAINLEFLDINFKLFVVSDIFKFQEKRMGLLQDTSIN